MISHFLMLMSVILFSTALVLYIRSVFSKPDVIARPPTGVATIAWIILGAALIIRAIEWRTAPFVCVTGALVFTAWVLTAMYLRLERQYRITALGIFVCITAAISVLADLIPDYRNVQTLNLRASPWSIIHIGASLIGYAGLALAFGTALGYMVQEYLLKAKRISRLQMHLPSLDTMDAISYRMVESGFFFLSIGVAAGAFWAMTAWHRIWDPKLGWAMITWLVYAAYLHTRGIRGWRSKWSNRLLIIGFACVLITFFGTGLLPAGLHGCLR